MKIRLATTFYPSEDAYIAAERGGPTAPSRLITADIDWAFGREPMIGEYVHFSGTSLKVEAVDWFPAEGLCHLKLSDAIGHDDERYLQEAGFR